MRQQTEQRKNLIYYCGTCGRITKNEIKQQSADEHATCAGCGEEVVGPIADGLYTPGPWKVNPDSESIVATHDLIDTVICNTTGRPINAAFFGQTYEEQQANTKLIAAAPEMYEALKLIQKSLNGSPFDSVGMLRAHRAIDAAIVKVEK